jgi:hypothetical protein
MPKNKRNNRRIIENEILDLPIPYLINEKKLERCLLINLNLIMTKKHAPIGTFCHVLNFKILARKTAANGAPYISLPYTSDSKMRRRHS